MNDELMTTLEVAKYLKVHQRTVYNYLFSDKLKGIKIGRAWRFKKSDIERWLSSRTINNIADNPRSNP